MTKVYMHNDNVFADGVDVKRVARHLKQHLRKADGTEMDMNAALNVVATAIGFQNDFLMREQAKKTTAEAVAAAKRKERVLQELEEDNRTGQWRL